MTVTEQLLDNARGYADGFDKGDLPLPPARKVAVVACMDARLDPQKVLGLAEGDGHVIRNAGGAVTDDAIRSLAISQRLLGTEEIILIHHSDCGMLTFSDDDASSEGLALSAGPADAQIHPGRVHLHSRHRLRRGWPRVRRRRSRDARLVV